jgi:hypothetical protein
VGCSNDHGFAPPGAWDCEIQPKHVSEQKLIPINW